MTVVVILVCG